MKLEKKVWPEYFEAILSGRKSFELRLGDFNCKPGDVLVLREWKPETKKYTGRTLEKEVTFVIKTKDFCPWTKEEVEKHGFQVISFKQPNLKPKTQSALFFFRPIKTAQLIPSQLQMQFSRRLWRFSATLPQMLCKNLHIAL